LKSDATWGPSFRVDGEGNLEPAQASDTILVKLGTSGTEVEVENSELILTDKIAIVFSEPMDATAKSTGTSIEFGVLETELNTVVAQMGDWATVPYGPNVSAPTPSSGAPCFWAASSPALDGGQQLWICTLQSQNRWRLVPSGLGNNDTTTSLSGALSNLVDDACVGDPTVQNQMVASNLKITIPYFDYWQDLKLIPDSEGNTVRAKSLNPTLTELGNDAIEAGDKIYMVFNQELFHDDPETMVVETEAYDALSAGLGSITSSTIASWQPDTPSFSGVSWQHCKRKCPWPLWACRR
jgi:hypothetical protein